MIIRAVIVDDELKSQKVLKHLITDFCPSVEIVGIADSVREAVPIIEFEKPDLLFLDVEMPEEDGFALFDYVKNRDFHVIFVTAHSKYAIQAVKIAALDYILKPVDIKELREVLKKIEHYLQNKVEHCQQDRLKILQANLATADPSEQKIALHTQTGWELFRMNQIVRCEADRAYCVFHLIGNKKITVSKSLKEYVDTLEGANFFRVHRSHMVNLSHVVRFVSGSQMKVVLSDQSLVDVAHRRKDRLLEILQEVTV